MTVQEEKIQRGKELLERIHKGENHVKDLQEIVNSLTWDESRKIFTSYEKK